MPLAVFHHAPAELLVEYRIEENECEFSEDTDAVGGSLIYCSWSVLWSLSHFELAW